MNTHSLAIYLAYIQEIKISSCRSCFRSIACNERKQPSARELMIHLSLKFIDLHYTTNRQPKSITIDVSNQMLIKNLSKSCLLFSDVVR